jgi:hypothetical protein
MLAAVSCSQAATPEEQFVEKTPEARLEYMRALPLDRKLHFYLYAMRRVRPRPVDLAVDLARGGAVNARVIANRIRSSNDIHDRNNLLRILTSMHETNIYDSCENRQIRGAIMPLEYSVEESEAQLLYALNFIDLCIEKDE